MAITPKLKVSIKCQLSGVDENGHERGSQRTLNFNHFTTADSKDEAMFRFVFACLVLGYSYEEWEEGWEEIFEEIFPE